MEAMLAWFLFFSIGVAFVYNAVFHIFFGDLAASYIGWENSPFQAEVGYASLGFAAVGFLAFRGGREVRFAAVLGPALFLCGARRSGMCWTWSARTTSPPAMPA